MKLLFLNLLLLTALSAQTLLIQNARILDGTGKAAFRADVLVQNGRIQQVAPNLSAPGATIINAEGSTLTPGLIDVHSHVGSLRDDLASFLYAGVTTAVHLGALGPEVPQWRRWMPKLGFPAPDLRIATRITTPGGHGSEMGLIDHLSSVVEPANVAPVMQSLDAYKPDLIKVFHDGWRYNNAPDLTSMRFDTLKAIVDEAHKRGIPVFTHTVTVDRAIEAANAGVDVIAHGLLDKPVSPELLAAMRRNGTAIAPTMAVYDSEDTALDPILEKLLTPTQLRAFNNNLRRRNATPNRKRNFAQLLANVQALHQAGIRVLAGTDSPINNAPHGWGVLREVQLLRRLGFSDEEAIRAATGYAAQALKLADRGTIEPGKVADMTLFSTYPPPEATDLPRVSRVWKNGLEINRETLLTFINAPEIAPSSTQAAPLIDDFEAPNSRWSTLSDGGAQGSRVEWNRVPGRRGSSLLALFRYAAEEKPFVRLTLPLSPGNLDFGSFRTLPGFEALDVSAYRALSISARGDATCNVQWRTTYAYQQPFQMPLPLRWEWSTITLPFAQLKAADANLRWTGKDALLLSIECSGAGNSKAWLQLDDIRLTR